MFTPSVTWYNLPQDVRRYIATYLDTLSLCFFAKTNQANLKAVLPLLIEQQKALLRPPYVNFVAHSGRSFCYTPEALYACGNNSMGQLGLGDKSECTTFTQVKGLAGLIQQVAILNDETFVYTDQGFYITGGEVYSSTTLRAALALDEGKKGSSTFTLVEGLPGKIKQIATAGMGFHLLMLTDQGLYATGENDYGQLGLGYKSGHDFYELKKIENLSGEVQQIAVGDFHTVVLTDQGAYTCGDNSSGFLGLGHAKKKCATLTKIETVPGEIQWIVAGRYRTFIGTDQGVYACGYNIAGELGLGHENPCTVFTKIENLPGKIEQIARGADFMAVLTDQGLFVCGSNRFGQLGLGHTNLCNRFTKVEFLPGKIHQIAAGTVHLFAFTDQGLYACGCNDNGELGVGHKKQCTSFTQVKNLPSEVKQLLSLYHQISFWKKKQEKVSHVTACQTDELLPPNKRLRLSSCKKYSRL